MEFHQAENAFVQPHDCVIGFGIPTTHADYDAAQERQKKGFVDSFNESWLRYRYSIVNPIEQLEENIKDLNVKVVRRLTLESFIALFRSELKVIVLFSHWEEDKVEFADGLIRVNEIINKIPIEIDQFIDLCICGSQFLAQELKNKCPNCIVKRINKTATAPHFWLKFYEVLFRHLSRKQLTYSEALDEVAISFLRITTKTGVNSA